jgi:hypothetical protein
VSLLPVFKAVNGSESVAATMEPSRRGRVGRGAQGACLDEQGVPLEGAALLTAGGGDEHIEVAHEAAFERGVGSGKGVGGQLFCELRKWAATGAFAFPAFAPPGNQAADDRETGSPGQDELEPLGRIGEEADHDSLPCLLPGDGGNCHGFCIRKHVDQFQVFWSTGTVIDAIDGVGGEAEVFVAARQDRLYEKCPGCIGVDGYELAGRLFGLDIKGVGIIGLSESDAHIGGDFERATTQAWSFRLPGWVKDGCCRVGIAQDHIRGHVILDGAFRKRFEPEMHLLSRARRGRCGCGWMDRRVGVFDGVAVPSDGRGWSFRGYRRRRRGLLGMCALLRRCRLPAGRRRRWSRMDR